MQSRKYWKVFDIGLQNTFVYRWNFLLRSLFGIVPLAGTVFIWRAIFEARGASIGGYEFSTMLFYFLLTILVDNLVTPTEDEWQIAADIRDGRISSFLIKPMSYLAYRLSLYASYRVLYTAVTILPVGIVFWCFREHLHFPQHFWTWLALRRGPCHGRAHSILSRLRPGHARLLDTGDFDGRLYPLLI